MDSATDWYITLQVRASRLLKAVEDFVAHPWSINRFREMWEAAEYLRKWMPKLVPTAEDGVSEELKHHPITGERLYREFGERDDGAGS